MREQTGRSAARRVSALVLLGGLLGTLSAAAQAPDDSTLAAARQLGQQGVVSYEKGDYPGAHAKLDRAYALVRMPTLGLWSARALVKLGRLVEAFQRYREVTLLRLETNASDVLRTAQTDAQREYAALEARLPQLTVTLTGASPTGVTFRLDGKQLTDALIGVPVPVDPGPHALEALRGSEVVRTAELTLAEGEQRSVVLDLPEPTPAQLAAATPVAPAPAAQAPADAAPPAPATVDDGRSGGRPSSVGPWLVIGGSAAVAIAGGVLLAMALSDVASVDDAPVGTKWASVEDENARAPVFSGIGIAMLATGAAGITGGLLWKLSASEPEPTAGSARGASASLSLSPGSVHVAGTF
jgi:hypothetical protein